MSRLRLFALLLLSSLALLHAHEGCDAALPGEAAGNEGQCGAPVETLPPPPVKPASPDVPLTSPTLDRIRARGTLICAHCDDTLGHSLITSETEASGMEPDLCRGLAAALGVEPRFWRMKEPGQRFPLLQNHQVDVALSITSKTLGRDMHERGSFSIPYFNDQHNLMYRSDAGIDAAKDLKGKSICLTEGTTNPNVFGDYLASISEEIGGVDSVERVMVPGDALALQYLAEGRCHGFVNDDSVVAGYVHKVTPPEGVEYKLASWPGAPFARAPFSACSIDGDEVFASVVDWFVNGMFLAESHGITQENVDAKFADPSIPGEAQRLLGAQKVNGHTLPFDMRAAIRAIGNYAEVYERNFGSFFPRSRANTLYEHGGAVIPAGFR